MNKDSIKLFLITGAAGHLGNTLVRKLSQLGHKIRCFVLPGEDTKSLEDLDLEIIEGDVRCPATIDLFLAGAGNFDSYLIHAASVVTIKNKAEKSIYDINVQGTANMLAKAKEHKVKRFVYVSSVHAIQEARLDETIKESTEFSPDTVVGFYAKTKAEATSLVLASAKTGLDAIVIHPSGVTGPNDYLARNHFTQLVIKYLNKNMPIAVDGGYDFVDVRDVALGIINACFEAKSGESYILSNRYFSIKEILDQLARLTNRKPVKIFISTKLAVLFTPFISFFAWLRKKRPLFTKYSLYTLKSNSKFSHAKASKCFAYKTRPMLESLRDTINFLRQENLINLN